MASFIGKLLPFSSCCCSDQEKPTSDAPEEAPALKYESSVENSESTATSERAIRQPSSIFHDFPDEPGEIDYPAPIHVPFEKTEGTENNRAASEENETMNNSGVQIAGDNKQSCSSNKTAWLGDPAIILKNESSYVVSFWVLQEERMKTSSSMETVFKEISASLEIDLGLNTSAGGKAIQKTERKTERREGTFYLTGDHRVGPEGTRVAFPKNCHELRVLGYFIRKENLSEKKWRRFKNKVYSIDRGDKIFTLVARDQEIQWFI